ncbi:MAG: hypothetical protein ABI425_06110 [Patescibacteria group bacterium]
MTQYSQFQAYLERLTSLYLRAVCAFHIFETLEELIAPNIVGKEANKNVDIMNSFGGFFVITKHSLNFYFLTELARILDNHKKSLHIEKVIKYAETFQNDMNVEEFKKNNPNRTFLEELATRYKGIEKEDLEKINKMMEETKAIREKLKGYRDQNLAHEDIEKEKYKISRDEVVKLFDLIKQVLNTFSNKTNFSTTSYKMAIDDSIRDTKNLLNKLKAGV